MTRFVLDSPVRTVRAERVVVATGRIPTVTSRSVKLALATALAVPLVGVVGEPAAHTAVPLGRLGLCIGDAPGTTDQVIVEARTYIKPFSLTVADGQTASCRAFDAEPGKYWITGGKYPQVPCDPDGAPRRRGSTRV